MTVVRRSVTQRKQLAQELRNLLSAYKELASLESQVQIEARHRLLDRINSKFRALNSLEGVPWQ